MQRNNEKTTAEQFAEWFTEKYSQPEATPKEAEPVTITPPKYPNIPDGGCLPSEKNPLYVSKEEELRQLIVRSIGL